MEQKHETGEEFAARFKTETVDKETTAVTAAEVLPVAQEDIPMLANMRQVFEGFASSMVRSREAQERVARAEQTVTVMQGTVTELREVRRDLIAKLKESEASVIALTAELEQTKAALAYEKEQLVNTFRGYDELKTIHAELQKQHKHTSDDRDYAQLEFKELQQNHAQVVESLAQTSVALDDSRRAAFEAEDKFQREIASLKAERNTFRDKFDQAKSHAARIMQLDRVEGEPIVQKFDA